MQTLGFALLILGLLAGLVSIPFGLPGVAIIFGVIVIYTLQAGLQAGITIELLVIFFFLTIVAETADNWLMMMGIKRYGGSTRSAWISLLGGLAGGLLLGPLFALFSGIAGPILGAFLGAFSAVWLSEYWKHQDVRHALRASWGTLLGRLAGMILKLIIGLIMVVLIAWKVAHVVFA